MTCEKPSASLPGAVRLPTCLPIVTPSLDGGDHHLDHPAQAVIRSDIAVAELAAERWLPVVARAVVAIVLRDARARRIVLPVVTSHLVDHQVQRRNHHQAVPAAA